MIEAVNSGIASTSVSRGNVSGSARAPEPQASPSSPVAPFISPRISLEGGSNQAVIQIRDSETGDVLTQFPSESRIRAIQSEQALQEASRSRQQVLTASADTTPQQSQSAPPPQQSFDAGSIATLQTSQGASTSDIQLATVAFSSGASAGVSSQPSLDVTA